MKNDQKGSIFIALIHNNNMERNAYIRPQLDKMANTLSSVIISERMDISFQPEIKPHGIGMALLRDAMYKKIDREWYKYRLLKPPLLVLDMARFLKISFMKYIVNKNNIGFIWQKKSAVEVIVTEKHIRAWGGFLDSDADFIMCLEDDVVFNSDSVEKIKDLIGLLLKKDVDTQIYVDIAGGCKLDELRIDNLQSSENDFFKFYKKPVTNTACAYLMNRQLAVTFHSIITRRPWLRLLGIDWMMNSLFVSMENNKIKSFCMHSVPSIFKHGTTTGEYVSWQAKVPN